MADPQGVSIAFAAGPYVASPTWTRIDTLAGCRVQSWTIQRGRATEFEKTGAGTANVRIADLDGLFDPTNGASPYFGDLLPDKQAAIALWDPVLDEWQTIFRGFIESFDFTLEPTRQVLFLDLQLVDAFGMMNDHELLPGKAGVTPPTGSEGNVVYPVTLGSVQDRIDAILDDVGWPVGLRSIFTGNVQVTQSVYAPGTEALAALYDAADAEFPGVANIYVDREGTITFHGRQARFRPDVAGYGIRRQVVGDPSLWEGDSTVCPIAELGFDLGKANLYNSVLAYPQHTAIVSGEAVPITETEIAAQQLDDATSITAHGTKALSFTDLLTLEGIATGNTALEECLLFATYYRDNYKDPLPRINRLVFKSRRAEDPLAGPLWKMLCRADISDRLTVTTAHPGGGGFDADDYYVEGLRYEGRPTGLPDVHAVTLELDVSPAALFDSNPFSADTDPA